MKPLIGVLANIKSKEDGPYTDYYMINKIYIDKLNETGALSLGILEVDDEVLDKCSGFLLIGGHKITENHYKVIEYALKNNKSLLGICNGMQAIVMYAYLYEECIKSNTEPTTSNIYNKYRELRNKGITILESLEQHGFELSQRKELLTDENLLKHKHDVNIKENSLLFDIYHKNKINVFSIHTYGVHSVPDTLEVMGLSDDNVVEAIKYKDKKVIGVQFHTELDETIELIERFIEEIRKEV